MTKVIPMQYKASVYMLTLWLLQISMNWLNLEKEYKFNVRQISWKVFLTKQVKKDQESLAQC
jgi:hypothetical protein